mmetsp:Transcript_27186/g.88840  ORF Transcript_27186/g.88840 Transcript_27186/m.88840 type:complete len:235 (+) Transcript_27186:1202-1906(+)
MSSATAGRCQTAGTTETVTAQRAHGQEEGGSRTRLPRGRRDWRNVCPHERRHTLLSPHTTSTPAVSLPRSSARPPQPERHSRNGKQAKTKRLVASPATLHALPAALGETGREARGQASSMFLPRSLAAEHRAVWAGDSLRKHDQRSQQNTEALVPTHSQTSAPAASRHKSSAHARSSSCHSAAATCVACPGWRRLPSPDPSDQQPWRHGERHRGMECPRRRHDPHQRGGTTGGL